MATEKKVKIRFHTPSGANYKFAVGQVTHVSPNLAVKFCDVQGIAERIPVSERVKTEPEK
jgi:hypothetical protein